jgi:hypothetical protein
MWRCGALLHAGHALHARHAQARVLVQRGELLEAVEAVLIAVQGTQAAAVVQEWVADARARAQADQAVKVLQARAAAVASTSV